MLPLLPLTILAAVPQHLRLIPGGAQAHAAAQALSDAMLVTSAVEGNPAALRALYDRHVDRVTLRAARLMGSSFEAQDVVQDAFLEALRDLPKLREPARFGAWLERIVVHQVHRRFRKRRWLRVLGLQAILSAVQRSGARELAPSVNLEELADPDAAPARLMELRKLDELLRRVSDVERSAWMLRRLDELPLAEAAAQCGCSLATIKRRIARVDALVAAHFVVEGCEPWNEREHGSLPKEEMP